MPIGYAIRRRSPSPALAPSRRSSREPLPPLSRSSPHFKTPDLHTDTGFAWYDAPDIDRTKTMMGVDRRKLLQAREEAALGERLAASRTPSATAQRWDRLHPHNTKARANRSPHNPGQSSSVDCDDNVELTSYRLQFGEVAGLAREWPRATSKFGIHRDKTTDMRDQCIRANQAVLGVIALPAPTKQQL